MATFTAYKKYKFNKLKKARAMETMKEQIISIIRGGWNENKPVGEVIRNIENATGLYSKYAVEQFTKLVFVAKP